MINTIFTTGAFLEPIKITDKQGNITWRWVVSEFTNDSFKDGEVYNPQETAMCLDELIKVEKD